MPSPIFEFFEMVAEELTLEESRVLTAEDFDPQQGDTGSVLDELRIELDVLTSQAAIDRAVDLLQRHFEERGSRLPFTYDKESGRFTAVDKDYLQFVTDIKELRGQGKGSKNFELGVMKRMSLRVTGALHRVGHPRAVRKKRKQFNDYLYEKIGFNGAVLLDKEKDGGLDILWVLPMGAIPHKPVVSLQCKNGTYTTAAGDNFGTTERSLNQHRGLMCKVHVLCVLFNDYITADVLPKKAMQWVPLGLSDLGSPAQATTTTTAI